MFTSVKFHYDCENDIVTWVKSGLGRAEDRERFLSAFVEEIIETLKLSEGMPSRLRAIRAEPVLGVSPPTYEWLYSELFVRFVVRFDYRSSWMNRFLPRWLHRWLPPSYCHITVMRLLP